MENLANISPTVLEKKCIGCGTSFQTYDFAKFYCTGKCQVRSKQRKPRVQENK